MPPPSLSKRVPDYPLQTGGKPGQEPAGVHAHNSDFRIVFGFTEWALLKKMLALLHFCKYKTCSLWKVEEFRHVKQSQLWFIKLNLA